MSNMRGAPVTSEKNEEPKKSGREGRASRRNAIDSETNLTSEPTTSKVSNKGSREEKTDSNLSGISANGNKETRKSRHVAL